MFSTDYAHRPQRGPNRPSTPSRPHSLKAEPSLSHSPSSGWGWPRRVSVEVDIEEKRQRKEHETPRMTKPEQPVHQESARSDLPNSPSEYTTASQGDKQPVLTRSAESGEQSHASAIDQEPGEKQLDQVQRHQGPSQSQPSDSRTLSPVRSDGSHRSRGTFTADKSPMSEPTRSPAVSVRRVGSGSSNSDKTMQQLETDTDNQTAELADASEYPDHQGLRSDEMQSNDSVEEDLQRPKAKDLTADARIELDPKHSVTTKNPEFERRPSNSESKGSKRSSVSASGGKPPGSFPGADSSSEEQPALDEETAIREPAAVPEAAVPEAAVPEAAVPEAAVPEATVPEETVPDSAAVPEALADQAAAGPKSAEIEYGEEHGFNQAGSPKAPNEPGDSPHVWSGMLPQEKALAEHKGEGNPQLGGAENESDKPHVTFKGHDPYQPVSEPRVLTNHTPQEPNSKEYGKEIDGQPLAKPQGSTAYQPDRVSNATDCKKTEQTRRPSRDSLRTRSRKPSVYIPLSKVAEAKGKIESATVQPPHSGEIINAEATPSPRRIEEPQEIGPDSHANLPNDTQKGASLNDGELRGIEEPKKIDWDSHAKSPKDTQKGAYLNGELSYDSPVNQREPGPNPEPPQTKATEIAPLSTAPTRKEIFDDEQSTATQSSPDDLSQEGTGSRPSSVVRKEIAPEDTIQRISASSERIPPNSPTKSHKSKRRSVKMSLPPPKIIVQSPSSASELPEPLPTPAAPIAADEYKIKTRSGTIVSVEHTVHGATDKLSQTPPMKRKIFLRKVRNIVARKVILNATLGRQMGGRTKEKLRQLAKGEELSASPIPAQENAPDLPPLRKRKSFIRKARNLAARQAFLDATLGRQVAAETKPVLRRMANGEMVVVEEGHSIDVKR